MEMDLDNGKWTIDSEGVESGGVEMHLFDSIHPFVFATLGSLRVSFDSIRKDHLFLSPRKESVGIYACSSSEGKSR